MPQSLYKLCLNFVAANIGAVESFTGFPSSIAKTIFERAIALGKLDANTRETKAVLEALAREYSTDFSFSLECHSLIFLSEFQETLEALMLPIEELDLSGCQLGFHSSSSLLANLHRLEKLRVLSLRDNHLSDEAFRKLILPLKVLGRGWSSLTQLDVSDNEVSPRALKGLLRMPKLAQIRFTLKSGLRGDVLETVSSDLKGRGFEPTPEGAFKGVANVGWGAQRLLERWQKKVEEFLREKKDKRNGKLKFYGSRKTLFLPERSSTAKVFLQTFTYIRSKTPLSPRAEEAETKRSLPDFDEEERESKKVKKSEGQRSLSEFFDLQLLDIYKV